MIAETKTTSAALDAWRARHRAAKKNEAGEVVTPAKSWIEDVRPAWLAWALLERVSVDVLPRWLVDYGRRVAALEVDAEGRARCTGEAVVRFAQLHAAERRALYLRGWSIHRAWTARDVDALPDGRVVMLRSAWLETPTQRGCVVREVYNAADRRWEQRFAELVALGVLGGAR